MPIDALEHMEEAWNLDDNPFPAEAIHVENTPIVQPSSTRNPKSFAASSSAVLFVAA